MDNVEWMRQEMNDIADSIDKMLKRNRQEFAEAERRQWDASWRNLMKVDLTNLLGDDSISIYGPWAYGDMGRFPLKEYRVEGANERYAVVRYDYVEYESQRPSQGTQLRETRNPDEAYATAYTAARTFGEQYANKMRVAFNDNLRRRPQG